MNGPIYSFCRSIGTVTNVRYRPSRPTYWGMSTGHAFRSWLVCAGLGTWAAARCKILLKIQICQVYCGYERGNFWTRGGGLRPDGEG
jgi:hypothetical protein